MHCRTRNILAIALLTILGSVAGSVQAQNAEDGLRLGQRSPASGARMTGIGTIGYGGFGDYTALYGNPAGLGLVQSSSLIGTFQSLETTDAASSQTFGFDANNSNASVDYGSIGNLAVVYKVPTTQGALAFGIGLNHVGHFGRELRFEGTNSVSTISSAFLPHEGQFSLSEAWDLETLDDLVFPAFNGGFIEFYPEFLEENPNAYPFLQAVNPGTIIMQNGRVEEEGDLSEISFGGSIEVAKGLLVGASLNVTLGRYDFNSLFVEEDFIDQNTAEDYSVFNDGIFLEGFAELEYAQRISSDLTGLSLRLGGSLQALPMLRLGLVLETPTRIGIDETYGATFTTWFDDGASLTYGDRLDDVGSGVFEYHLITPMRIGIGAVLEAGNVRILADAQRVDRSRTRFGAADDQVLEDVTSQISSYYRTVYNLGAGVEVGIGKVQLRAGWALRPDPVNLSEFSLETSSGGTLDRDRRYLSAGIGYQFSQKFQVNAGWSMERFDDAYLPYPQSNLPEFGPDSEVLIDESITRQRFVVGGSYRF